VDLGNVLWYRVVKARWRMQVPSEMVTSEPRNWPPPSRSQWTLELAPKDWRSAVRAHPSTDDKEAAVDVVLTTPADPWVTHYKMSHTRGWLRYAPAAQETPDPLIHGYIVVDEATHADMRSLLTAACPPPITVQLHVGGLSDSEPPTWNTIESKVAVIDHVSFHVAYDLVRGFDERR
jgi:hypothetical protein